MKILLINAPFPFEERPTAPLGLTSLAGYLLREGVDVRIEDCMYITEEGGRLFTPQAPSIDQVIA